jgi:hypothetical protein
VKDEGSRRGVPSTVQHVTVGMRADPIKVSRFIVTKPLDHDASTLDARLTTRTFR